MWTGGEPRLRGAMRPLGAPRRGGGARSAAAAVPTCGGGAHLGASLEKQRHAILMPLARRAVQRRDPARVARARRGAGVQQHARGGVGAARAGDMQQRHALLGERRVAVLLRRTARGESRAQPLGVAVLNQQEQLRGVRHRVRLRSSTQATRHAKCTADAAHRVASWRAAECGGTVPGRERSECERDTAPEAGRGCDGSS